MKTARLTLLSCLIALSCGLRAQVSWDKEKYPDYDEWSCSDDFDDFEEYAADKKATVPFDASTLLGNPQLIQDAIYEECEAVSRNIYMGDTEYYSGGKYSDEEKAEIKEASAEWMLLMQLDSVLNDEIDLCFGDSGKIYFMIRKQDLAALKFDDAWLILQCF